LLSWKIYVGAGIYLSGLLLCVVSNKDFAMPANKEINNSEFEEKIIYVDMSKMWERI